MFYIFAAWALIALAVGCVGLRRESIVLVLTSHCVAALDLVAILHYLLWQ